MAQKEVRVIINGTEYVSVAAKKAEDGMQGFFGKVKSWSVGFADLKAAWDLVAGAVSRVSGVIVDSFAAYDELQNSQRKLEGTSKITGLSMDYLSSVAEKAKRTFGLSSVTANGYATEVAKLAVASGDAGKATDLLGAFLNVGAARGLTASQSLDAARQAILGIDEGTDKLFGKNPSALWAEYAVVIGKSAGKFSDTDKQAALAWATLEAGNKTIGSYSSFLTSAQGAQGKLNDQLREMQARIGEAMQPARAFATEVMSALASNSAGGVSALASLTISLVDLLRALTPVLGPILAVSTALVETFSAGISLTMLQVRSLAYNTAIGVGNMLQSFGDLVTKGGTFLKVFGIDVVQSTGKSLREAGDAMRAESLHKLQLVELDFVKFTDRSRQIVQRWKGESIATTKALTDGVADETGKLSDRVAPGIEKAATKTGDILSEKLGPPLARLIRVTEVAITDLNTAASNQLPPQRAKEFDAHMQAIAANAQAIADRIIPIASGTGKGADNAKKMSVDVGDVARGALEVADAFGVIDGKTKATLQSVVQISQSIAGIVNATSKEGLAGGIAATVAAVANVAIQIIGGDAARKKLISDNNAAIARNTAALGDLNLNVSGDDLLGVQRVLESLSGRLRDGRGAANQTDLLNALRSEGLTMADLDRVANELGIRIKSDSGALSVAGLQQLWSSLGSVELGRVGSSFAEQLAFFRESQQLDGASGAGEVRDLLTYLRDVGRVRALDGIDLSDPEQALRVLRTSLNNGTGVSAEGLGRLTGGQLSSILTELISTLSGERSSGTSGASTTGGGTASSADAETGPTPAPGSAPVASPLLDAVSSQTDVIRLHQETNVVLLTRIADATEDTAGFAAQILEVLMMRANTESLPVDAALQVQRAGAALDRGRAPVLR